MPNPEYDDQEQPKSKSPLLTLDEMAARMLQTCEKTTDETIAEIENMNPELRDLLLPNFDKVKFKKGCMNILLNGFGKRMFHSKML